MIAISLSTFWSTDSLSFSLLMILMATFFPSTQCVQGGRKRCSTVALLRGTKDKREAQRRRKRRRKEENGRKKEKRKRRANGREEGGKKGGREEETEL